MKIVWRIKHPSIQECSDFLLYWRYVSLRIDLVHRILGKCSLYWIYHLFFHTTTPTTISQIVSNVWVDGWYISQQEMRNRKQINDSQNTGNPWWTIWNGSVAESPFLGEADCTVLAAVGKLVAKEVAYL